jgi:glycosyltransferase involved in cell wall biosynthesis
LGQLGVTVRILITDDCSADNTFDFLDAMYADDPRIVLRRNSRNIGQMATLASLLERVESHYFAFCDHDDVWLNSKLEVTLALLIQENTDLAYTDLFLVNENLEVTAQSAMAAGGVFGVRGRRPLAVLLKNPVHGCTILCRSTLIAEAVPLPKEITLHDRYFAILASCRKGLSYCDGRQVFYRQHGANTVGVVSQDLSGLGRRSQGRIRAYLSNRLASRQSYLAAWRRWDPKSKSASFLAFHARQPVAVRLLLLPCYLVIAFIGAFEIGPRAIIADAILTTISSPGRVA